MDSTLHKYLKSNPSYSCMNLIIKLLDANGKKTLFFKTIFACLASKIIDVINYTNSLANADCFYANFTNTTFQKIPIPHLTHTMKQKFLHYHTVLILFY